MNDVRYSVSFNDWVYCLLSAMYQHYTKLSKSCDLVERVEQLTKFRKVTKSLVIVYVIIPTRLSMSFQRIIFLQPIILILQITIVLLKCPY